MVVNNNKFKWFNPHRLILSMIVFTCLLLFTTSSAYAINTINKININPSDSLQGGNVDICADITSNGNPTVNAIINKPSGQSVNVPLFPSTNKCYQSLNGTEYYASFTDTNQIGNYSGKIESVKGGEYDYKNVSFKTTPISVLIDYVQRVAEVDNVKQVEKINQSKLSVFGTEYIGGDNGKMFLQYLDSSYNAIEDSECFLTVWYPNNTYMYNHTLMSYLHDGIYYKNFLVPNVDGVYPASAECFRPIQFNNIIYYSAIRDNFETGNWIGGYNWSECPFGDPNCQNGWDYDPTLTSIVNNATALGCYEGNYCAQLKGSYGFFERGFPEIFIEGTVAYNITFWFKFTGFQNTETAEVYLFDGNWHLIKSISLSGNYTNGVWYKINYFVTESEYNLETIMLGFYAYAMPSSNDILYVDNVTIDVVGTNITLSNDTEYQILRGAGEIHVSKSYNNIVDYFNNTNSIIDNIPQRVWNYTTRNLTYYQDVTNYTLIQELTNITFQLNNLESLILSVNNTLYYKVDNDTYQILNVINQSTNTLTLELLSVNNSIIDEIQYSTNYLNDSIYNSNQAIIDTVQSVNASLSNNLYSINQSLSSQLLNINNSIIYQLSNLILDVNSSLSQELFSTKTEILDFINVTYNSVYNLLGLVPQNVWNYPVRNLTYYEDVTNYTLIQENQYNYTGRFDSLDAQLLVMNDTLNGIVSNVWLYSNRTLTYYPQQLDLTNYSLINDGVWSYNNRTLTEFVFDNTNYSYIIDSLNDSVALNNLMSLIYAINDSIIYRIDTIDSDVWTYIDRNLTYYPQQLDLTNYSQVAISVWEYNNRNLTYYEINNITPEDVWTYINRTLTYYDVNNITAQDVWEYNNRTLTFYPTQQDLTNYTYITESVWNYTARYTHGVELN